jgi:hypothetical protein
MANLIAHPTRSWLFTPATRPDRFAKASEVGADVAILDLEDAVAPIDKNRARETALDFLRSSKTEGVSHALRLIPMPAFPTSTRYSKLASRLIIWCCPRRRRSAISKSSTA